MPIRLTLHGAASTVTGYLIEHDHGRFLVDCVPARISSKIV